jgi:hypothetical protein
LGSPENGRKLEFWGINWHLRHTSYATMIYEYLWSIMDIYGYRWILTWKAPRLTSPDITFLWPSCASLHRERRHPGKGSWSHVSTALVNAFKHPWKQNTRNQY